MLTIAAVSLFSIYVLLPKTGDPVMAVCVGLFVLLGPAVLIKGSGEGAATRRARR